MNARAELFSGPPIDVAVIGGGPAGLAAATALARGGAGRIVVLERGEAAGGIPRHCGHYPFGMSEFRRVLRGPDYAARLVARAGDAGVEIACQTTVTALGAGGALDLTTPETGHAELRAGRVIYATGMREATRAARLTGGMRLAGVVNTGALQDMVYLRGMRPFRRPLIVGSELVAMSAVSTCREAGIRPVAMIEPAPRARAFAGAGLWPRLNGLGFHPRTRLVAILGEKRVTGALVEGPGGMERRIDCDGVILAGDFTPEATLARMGHLALDPQTGGPAVDERGQTSDPAIMAVGNVLGAARSAGASWRAGRRLAQAMLRSAGRQG